jgi:ribosomal protein L29
MSKVITIAELRKMQEADLIREINQQYRKVGKLKLMVGSNKEKAHHLLKIERRQLAKMLTILSEIRKGRVCDEILSQNKLVASG